jgi:hypothetical protein
MKEVADNNYFDPAEIGHEPIVQADNEYLFLEVLIDIRDQLAEQNKKLDRIYLAAPMWGRGI